MKLTEQQLIHYGFSNEKSVLEEFKILKYIFEGNDITKLLNNDPSI